MQSKNTTKEGVKSIIVGYKLEKLKDTTSRGSKVNMAQTSKAGPSNPKTLSTSTSKQPAKGLKIINKTVDLLRKNDGLKKKGKGKEREVLGDIVGLVQGRCSFKSFKQMLNWNLGAKSLPGAIQVERFAEVIKRKEFILICHRLEHLKFLLFKMQLNQQRTVQTLLTNDIN